NAGSSSLKFSLFLVQNYSPTLLFGGQLEGLYTAPHFKAKDANGVLLGEKNWPKGEALGHDGAIAFLTEFLRQQSGDYQLLAVGHRVVHGGNQYAAPVKLTSAVAAELEKLCPLAPLHQPHNLKPIQLLLNSKPDLLQVACFDTAFHHTQPAVAKTLALPESITSQGVRRYGFHGLSYEYIASALPAIDTQAAQERTIVLHLGNGVSLCALHGGKSVATTMGFTALDGIPMGSRCGSLDPGVLLYLMDELKMDARAIEKLLYQQSGLLGVSGISSDMRALLASAEPAAQFAVELFIYRIAREIGSLTAALGGLDALVFTAGIGENAPVIRERILAACAWLGVKIDADANASGSTRITAASSRVSAWVIPTNEELMIARHTAQVLKPA
ncbi:MAG TPA: acetate/propionate family kinase, partial [Pseudomonadales bacterium]|nr:acetate/propionate family kinase [Pseudomonadales bacterium]